MPNSDERLIPDVYLGDGVYAGFDGYHLWLDLRGQDSTTKIALDPYVLVALDTFRNEIKKRQERALKPDLTQEAP